MIPNQTKRKLGIYFVDKATGKVVFDDSNQIFVIKAVIVVGLFLALAIALIG